MLNKNCITSVISAKAENIFVAYSGGVDSHVLLHLIALDPAFKKKVTAVYINHGLQKESDEWAVHCQSVASALSVRFRCIKVKIDENSGDSLEELAREARYQALQALLARHDVVLLAQHREDQMETVLLQLFRGAGVQGLSGMPVISTFGEGRMYRPFLDISKKDIDHYAIAHQLNWVEDPSNESNDFDRNFLRNQVIPKLKQKWPALDKTVSRSARHCANAYQLTEDIVLGLYIEVADEQDLTLNIDKLLMLNNNKQCLVIRQWYKTHQLRMPSEKVVDAIIDEVVNALESRNPEIRGQGYSIKRYRKKLFCLKEKSIKGEQGNLKWPTGLRVIELKNNSRLIISETEEGIPKKIWDKAEVVIKFREGAEKIRLQGREGRHSLKKLYQERGIPPWQRNNIPLVYLDNNLASIADLWRSADYSSDKGEKCYRIEWIQV